MLEKTPTCQNCKKDFQITTEDFDFYTKIDVPPPTWCPECRLVRRLMFQNERTFHWRTCDLCSEKKLMIFPPEDTRQIYCSSCWWSDKWDPTGYSLDLDFTKPFLEQFKTLLFTIPVLGLNNIPKSMVNTEYSNICSYLKNCYLLFNSDYNEYCLYSAYLERSKNCMDLVTSDLCENCYEGHGLYKCAKTFFSTNCNECVDVWFSQNCIGCMDCFGCINLKNKQYYIFNEKYSKEDYFEKVKSFNLSSRNSLREMETRTEKYFAAQPHRYMQGLKNQAVSGDYIYNSKNVTDSYEVAESQDCRYCQLLIIGGNKDCYDYTMWGSNAERIYESMCVGDGAQNVKFSFESWAPNSNMEYCWNIFQSSHDLFGCIGIRKGEYMILNKRYEKDEYYALVQKIKTHMNELPYVDAHERVYRYGEFFPLEFSVHGYNESIAQKYFPLTKQEILQKGYRYTPKTNREYAIDIPFDQIPDAAAQLNGDILGKILACRHKGECTEQCTEAFRITEAEYEFYMQMKLPAPDLCPNCRHYARKRKRNDLHFYTGTCSCDKTTHTHGSLPCATEFLTTYKQSETKNVFCEKCYQQEVI